VAGQPTTSPHSPRKNVTDIIIGSAALRPKLTHWATSVRPANLPMQAVIESPTLAQVLDGGVGLVWQWGEQ